MRPRTGRVLKRAARPTISRMRRGARIGIGARAVLLVSATLAPSPASGDGAVGAASAGDARTGADNQQRRVTPSDALAEAKAQVDEALAGFSTAADEAAAGLQTFVEEADIAEDKSMEEAGVAAKSDLDEGLAEVLSDAEGAIPEADRLEPSWNGGAANACRQNDGNNVVAQGTAVCTTNSDRDDRARARAEGNGASATANAVHDGDAEARSQGDGSAATARSGDPARTGQRRNVSDAVSTGGSTATANAGLGDHDGRNRSTAVADGTSLATADSNFGDENEAFSGSINNGEARASNTSGDRNRAIALGANGSNDGNGPAGARATSLLGFDNTSLSVADGQNSTAITNAGYGDRHRAAATSGPNSQARADSAQGEESASFSQATDRAHALAFNSYGDHMLAIAQSTGNGSTGLCGPIGQPVNSGETTYPPDACATANARAVDGEANTAISIVDEAKGYSVSERGARNTAVTRATNGGDIIWNTTPSLPNQPPNPHAGLTPDCPWPLPPLPQAQQPCGNATAKASYGDGNLAVAVPNGDHAFAWSEASGGSYNQTLAAADGANSRARSRGIYNNYGTAKSSATNGGNAETLAVRGYGNVALANADGIGSVANATAAGPHSQATASSSAGGTATAMHNTTTASGFQGIGPSAVSCSNESVTYAMIGTGQTCGDGF